MIQDGGARLRSGVNKRSIEVSSHKKLITDKLNVVGVGVGVGVSVDDGIDDGVGLGKLFGKLEVKWV